MAPHQCWCLDLIHQSEETKPVLICKRVKLVVQTNSDEERSALVGELAACWLAPENGLNRMNGVNVSCPPPLSAAGLDCIYQTNKPSWGPLSALCALLCVGLSLCRDHRTQE